MCFSIRKIWPLLIIIGIQKKLLANSVLIHKTPQKQLMGFLQIEKCVYVYFRKSRVPIKHLKCSYITTFGCIQMIKCLTILTLFVYLFYNEKLAWHLNITENICTSLRILV